MIGSILRQALRGRTAPLVMRPATLVIKRNVTSETGAIREMPKGISKLSPFSLTLVVALGLYCGAKASEYGAWLLKEFSLFEYDDDDDDDD